MSSTGRACHIRHITDDAKHIFQEIRAQRELEALVAMANEDPIAPYRTRPWRPRFVVWELTLMCNMRCAHCGSSAGRARDDELSLDQMLRVCDELGELECERVTLLGGEPLIHPHWEQVAARIRSNGYRANVITNGWTLDEHLCDRIAAAQLSIVGISVDGMRESHDKLRRRSGSFDRILHGMKLLKERNLPIAVATVVTNDSLDDLEQMYELLTEHDVGVWQLQIGAPLGRLQKDDPVLMRVDRLPQLLDFIENKQALGHRPRVDMADCVGYYSPQEMRGIRAKTPGGAMFWTGCHAGIQAMGLDSNGTVKGCQSLPSTPAYMEGNVRDRSLKDIWNDPAAFRYTRRFSLSDLREGCAACRYGALCKGGCTSGAISHTGCAGDNPMCWQRVAGSR
ncbi:MAG: radical SAM protein [Polyangiaceae bacterium]|jgi:radical SAM protein with 4Fe4S-binding SPASM domain|nr:radical SAM protein [Polyangiaceae bacterium]